MARISASPPPRALPFSTPARAARDAATAKAKVERLLGVTVAEGETPYQYVRARCLALLAAEVANDPDGRGYAGMTDAEIALEISEGHAVTSPVVRASRLAVACFPDPIPGGPRTIAALLASSTVGAKVRAELENDPAERGYRANVGDEAAVLALLTDTAGTDTTVYPARLPVVFKGIPFAPNAVDAEDVATAKAGG